MSDKNDLVEYNTDELIEALNYCGYDPYYSEYRGEIIAEIKKRLNNRNPKAQLDAEAATETQEYCERYEPTYNPEDGSL